MVGNGLDEKKIDIKNFVFWLLILLLDVAMYSESITKPRMPNSWVGYKINLSNCITKLNLQAKQFISLFWQLLYKSHQVFIQSYSLNVLYLQTE